MTSKIFRSTVLLTVLVLFCSLSIVVGVLYKHFTQVQVAQLKDELSLAVTGTEQYGNAFLENIEADRFRVTWIDENGKVLFDTQMEQDRMENHADREEIKEAREEGHGSAVRISTTSTEQTFYEAQKLKDGTILRISDTQKSAWSLVAGMLWPIIVIAFLALGSSAFLARHMAAKIVEPLNKLDLENPLKTEVYEEISPLLHRIHQQHNLITSQVEELHRKTNEFSQITESMQEGLVLLDSHCTILSINPFAKTLFEVDDTCIGKNFLMIDTTTNLRTAVNNALNKGRGYASKNRKGRDYQFDLSPIKSEGMVIGAVILVFDVTERIRSEQLRREFSANVSHELKTPLQGIIGSAELMENGLVKPEDVPRFIGTIRKEATRLVNLIEDIIHLSQLDEEVELPTEKVDMLAIAKEVQSILENSAIKKGITVTVTGMGFTLQGVPGMLREAIYNLCDNGIKYNVEGGNVNIHIENKCVTVSDTGIGISPEHQSRVYERFYRVDKSHSKASGGTGLGLSIVKHVVSHHNAVIQMESVPGKGTKITIQFT